MTALLAFVLLFAVALDTPFVSAEASALRVEGDRLVVEVRVDTDRPASAVLVRAVGPDGVALDPVAMEQQGTVWVTRMPLPIRSDIDLVLEHVDPDGRTIVSPEMALIQLGVDPAVFSLDEARPSLAIEPSDSAGSGRSQWGWLAVALGAVAAALLLLITVWRRPDDEPAGDE